MKYTFTEVSKKLLKTHECRENFYSVFHIFFDGSLGDEKK